MLKLKRKLQFRDHVYFQAVRPQFIYNALNWLKLNNPLYSNIEIDIENINTELMCLEGHNSNALDSMIGANEDVAKNINRDALESDDDNEEKDDPLNEHRQATSETCLQSVLPDYPITMERNSQCSLGNEVYNIAPGENKHPVSTMRDGKCEEVAFPVLFPNGRFGYTYNRDIKLSPVKYFNARLLHYSGRFATNPEYLFFAHFVIEQKKVSDSINIALKKVQAQPVTAAEIKSDLNKLKTLVCQDQAYLFLRQIPGTPPY